MVRLDFHDLPARLFFALVLSLQPNRPYGVTLNTVPQPYGPQPLLFAPPFTVVP